MQREEDCFLDFDLFLTLCVRSILRSHHTLNESNLVQTRSVKVGGLCVVAVPAGQDHCWMMPRS